MRILSFVLLSGCCLLAACAGSKSVTVSSADDYVEVDNPAVTMSSSAPAKIWVPRRYVESGVPRGGGLLKSGADNVISSFKQSPQQTQAEAYDHMPTTPVNTFPLSSGIARMVAKPHASVRNQIALLEIGKNGILKPFYEKLYRAEAGILIAPTQPVFLAQYSSITNQVEKGEFTQKLQQDYSANVTVYVSAPDGVAPGKTIVAEVFDSLGGVLVRRFDAVIPVGTGTERFVENSSIDVALVVLSEKVVDLIALLPWYARITAVSGNRAYISAGKEVGLRIGQVLMVYHGGNFVEGLGFAPGERTGTLEVSGFVGPNGSFCVIKEGQIVQAKDVVSVE